MSNNEPINLPTHNNHVDHEKSHVAERLSYLGYGILTLITAVGTLSPLFATVALDVGDLKTAWVGATTSLITWLIAKARFGNGNGK